MNLSQGETDPRCEKQVSSAEVEFVQCIMYIRSVSRRLCCHDLTWTIRGIEARSQGDRGCWAPEKFYEWMLEMVDPEIWKEPPTITRGQEERWNFIVNFCTLSFQ